MKRMALIFCLTLAAIPAAAKRGPWLTGTISYKAAVMIDDAAGIPASDRFYDGEYMCTRGDEHHAPVCSKSWTHEGSPEEVSIRLDDGTSISFMPHRSPDINSPYWNFSVLITNWELSYVEKGSTKPKADWWTSGKLQAEYEQTPIPPTATFHYRLLKFHKDTGYQEIEIEMLNPTPGMPLIERAAYLPKGLNWVH